LGLKALQKKVLLTCNIEKNYKVEIHKQMIHRSPKVGELWEADSLIEFYLQEQYKLEMKME